MKRKASTTQKGKKVNAITYWKTEEKNTSRNHRTHKTYKHNIYTARSRRERASGKKKGKIIYFQEN